MIEVNPVDDMKDILSKRKAGHHAALTKQKEVAPLLRAIDDFDGSFVVKCALKLAPLLFVRPGELRQMEWNEIDFELLDGSMSEWNIPGRKMKMKEPHVVPLCTQYCGSCSR